MLENYVNDANILKFVETVLKENPLNDTQIEFAKDLCENIKLLLKFNNMYNEKSNPAYVEVLFGAAFLESLFEEKGDITSLFKMRQYVKEHDELIKNDYTYSILQTLEGKYGRQGEIPLLTPAPGSPVEIFAIALLFTKKEHGLI